MWPGLIILAASALLKNRNDRAALKRQQNLAGAMHAYQRGKSDEAMAATEELISKQTPLARGTELSQVTRDRERSLRDTVGAAQAFEAPASTGKLSADFRAAQEKEATSIAERTRRAIEQLASMGAPAEQQLKHQLRYGKAAGTVDSANDAMESVGRAYAADIDNVRPNRFVDMASRIGMGVGGAMLGGAAGTGAALSANNGQGYEDASGNLYDSSVTTPQDERIRRELQMKRAFGLWGQQPSNAR